MPSDKPKRAREPKPHAKWILVSCGVVLFVALGLVVIGFLSREKVHHERQGELQVPLDTDTGTPPPEPLEPLAVPTSTTGQPHATIQQAMGRCDADAAKDWENLYFLLTPVFPVNFESATLLLPPGDNHGSFYLIQSQLVLSGLRDGSLEINSRPYEVSLVDSQTGRTKKWVSTTGPAQFTLPDAAALQKYRIGLQFENDAVTWSDDYGREPGSCYRVNVFLAKQLYSPFPGRLNSRVFKSFPSPAETLRCANHVCERDVRP